MISAENKKTCEETLISIVKKQTGSKKLKKISKYLRNLSEEDVKKAPELKIKVFEEEKEEEKKSEFIIVAPVIGLQHYSEDFKKSNSNTVKNNDVEYDGVSSPSTVDGDKEEINQIDSSDLSD